MFGPASRGRLERFARRQALVITADNGNLVIKYLRTTRRWRVVGLTTGILLSVAWLVGRHVLARPRPLAAAADRQLADDALRDRSLHVLAGCAIALSAVPAANLAIGLGHSLVEADGGGPLVAMGVVLSVAGPICGWAVATRSKSPEAAALRPETGHPS